MNMGKKNLELFEFLEANYIPAIKNANDDKDLNVVLFKTVNYLLGHIKELSSNALSTASEKEKKRIFSFFGKDVAQAACDFYQESKDYLDPVTLNGEIGQRLKNKTQQVIEVNASLDSIERNEADLLKEEKELNQLNEKHTKLMEKVSALRKIKETVSGEFLKTLEDEYDLYNLHFGENSSIVNKMKEYGVSGIEDFLRRVDSLRDSFNSELTRFDNMIKDVIEKLEKEKEDIGRRNKTLP